MPRIPLPSVPLPPAWNHHTQASVLVALALARWVLMHVRGWCADSRIARVRLAGDRDAAVVAARIHREHAAILLRYIARIEVRPHYSPDGRFDILALRAQAGWTIKQTAANFRLSPDTIVSWMKRLDEHGEGALLKTHSPINKFGGLVEEIVRRLRDVQPALGKVRIAQFLARAGLHISPATIARIWRRTPKPVPPASAPEATEQVAAEIVPAGAKQPAKQRVTARYPNHVWNVDITLLPRTGWWVPWLPQCLTQRAPFCAWLVVVLDHYSRAVVGWKLFDKQPTAEEVARVLDAARRASGVTPKYIVSDQGVQFRDHYKRWCETRGVLPRFGAIGEHGSIAVLERFFRSLKTEMLRKLPWVPLAMNKLAAEVTAYVGWYHEHRPHQGLGGVTPLELRTGTRPAAQQRRIETRPGYPLRDKRAKTKARRPTGKLVLVVEHFGGREHLPVVSLREAA